MVIFHGYVSHNQMVKRIDQGTLKNWTQGIPGATNPASAIASKEGGVQHHKGHRNSAADWSVRPTVSEHGWTFPEAMAILPGT